MVKPESSNADEPCLPAHPLGPNAIESLLDEVSPSCGPVSAAAATVGALQLLPLRTWRMRQKEGSGRRKTGGAAAAPSKGVSTLSGGEPPIVAPSKDTSVSPAIEMQNETVDATEHRSINEAPLLARTPAPAPPAPAKAEHDEIQKRAEEEKRAEEASPVAPEDVCSPMRRQKSKHLLNEVPSSARVEDSGATMLRQKSQQPLKEVMSDPLFVHGHQRCSDTASRMPYASSLPLLGGSRLADWPREVCILLDSFQMNSQDDAGECAEWSHATEELRLYAGAYQIPHPRKADSGGEDSFFLCPDGSAAGVADGVGEWEWRFKLNPRAFADELMSGACSRANRVQDDASIEAKHRAASALSEGFAASKSFGSATALVAVLDRATSELGVANLGDSGMRQVRQQHSGSSELGMRVVGRTTDQQHAFNCPFQLARLPEPADFPRLLAEGKGALVRAVKNCPASRQDKPENADLYTFDTQEGDLIIIGTDGVFDNLHDREVCQLAESAVSPWQARQSLDVESGKLRGHGSTDPSKLAEAIAQAAFYRSRDASARVPFSLHAREAGLYHVGGKMDDITVVVAWVVRTTL